MSSSSVRRMKRKNDAPSNFAIKSRRKYLKYPRRNVSLGPKVGSFRFPMYFGDQPSRKFARLKYVTNFATSGASSGNIELHEFRANGMYDVEVSLGGHQPYGFDQLMDMYSYFTVLSSRITFESMANDTNLNLQWRMFCYTELGTPNSALTSGGLNALMELPLQSQGVAVLAGEHQEKNRTVSLSAYIPRFAGKKPSDLVGDHDWQGTKTNDPSKVIYFGLVGFMPGLAAAPASAVKVTIEYNAVFTEPKFFISS